MQEVLLQEWSGSDAAGQPAASSSSATSNDSADLGVLAEDDVEEKIPIIAEAERSGFVLLPMIGALKLLVCTSFVSWHLRALGLPSLALQRSVALDTSFISALAVLQREGFML